MKPQGQETMRASHYLVKSLEAAVEVVWAIVHSKFIFLKIVDLGATCTSMPRLNTYLAIQLESPLLNSIGNAADCCTIIVVFRACQIF